MTGEIPSGLVPGEDGRGKRVSIPTPKDLKDSNNVPLSGNTTNQDELRVLSEGLQYAPKELVLEQNSWMRREQEEKRRALLQEKERLEKLAQEEENL